jgi:hypothetical protein
MVGPPSYCVPKRAGRADGRLEINAAFNAIDQAFAGAPHTPYKKSLAHGPDGGAIELAFISPAVAERYRDLLDALGRDTGWPIRAAAAPNQHRIKEIAATLAQEYGIAVRKNPSYFGAQRLLRLPVNDIVAPDKAAELTRRFEDATGFTLDLVKE